MPKKKASDAPRIRTLQRRSPKAAEVLANELLGEIVRRGLEPGKRLPQETEMVAKYGVARSTVREALRILEINGVVTMRTGPQGGPTVRGATPADFGRMASLFLRSERVTLEELLYARAFLEPALVREATRRQDADFIDRVSSLLTRGRSIDSRDDDAYRKLSREFHETMASASPNRVFTLFGLALMAMFAGRMDHSVFPTEERKQVLLEHERVLKAILDKDEAKAERLMAKHMAHFIDGVRARQPNAFAGIISWE